MNLPWTMRTEISYATLGSTSFSINVWGIGEAKLRRGPESREVWGWPDVCDLLEEDDSSSAEVEPWVHLLCGFSVLFRSSCYEGDATLLRVPSVCGLPVNGEIELVLRTESACVGKGKENGNVYCPEGNRGSVFFFSVPVVSDWSGSPISLSQTVNSRFRNRRDPPEWNERIILPFSWKL